LPTYLTSGENQTRVVRSVLTQQGKHDFFDSFWNDFYFSLFIFKISAEFLDFSNTGIFKNRMNFLSPIFFLLVFSQFLFLCFRSRSTCTNRIKHNVHVAHKMHQDGLVIIGYTGPRRTQPLCWVLKVKCTWCKQTYLLGIRHNVMSF